MASQTQDLIGIVRRGAEQRWAQPGAGMTIIGTTPIGFAGAAEDDRQKWLNGFRRLIDGLDAPLQVVIEVRPGTDEELAAQADLPADFDDMRGADLAFASAVRRSATSHSVLTSLVVADAHASRLGAA